MRAISKFLFINLILLPLRAYACTVDARATVQLGLTGPVLTVPVTVNGIAANFILDTGAERSVVSEQAVHRLNLARDQWVGTTMSGIGGIDRRPNADPSSLTLAGVPLTRRTLNHDTSLTVADLPRFQSGVDGLLGRDYLSSFDLDLDVSALRLTLYSVKDCTGRFLPWSGHYTAVPIDAAIRDAVILPVELDGHPLRAMLDTGSASSLLAAPGMYRMGITTASLAGDQTDTVHGLGLRVVTMRRHIFHTLTMGGQSMPTPELWVAPIHLSPFADLLLGEDWLAGRRVWMSFATRQVFLAGP